MFNEHLARLERGEVSDVESLCAEHPEYADELRRLEQQRTASQLVADQRPVSLFRGRGERAEVIPGSWDMTEGRTIGDFRLVQCIGRGGMGEVWEAEQLSLSRRVALKLLLPERVDTRGLDFFAREARAGGKLAHPGIVAVYGTGETDGVHWIAMELVQENCDLRRSLDGLRETEIVDAEYYQQVAEFVAKLADALEATHVAGVIHRDLKPSNILVAPDDSPKLTDFGLAKLIDEHSLSVVGEVAGTYYYMSPEQVALKHVGIDYRTDIFSLGVVLYEMLTLVKPFEGDTSEQVARKILWQEAPDPRLIRSRTPRDLAVICAKAMEKEPSRRYESMADFAADLRRHLADEPIVARPSGPLLRLAKWSRRNPTKSVAGAVGVVALMAISVLAWKLDLERNTLAETNEQLQTKTTEAEASASLATQRADELAQANEQLESKTAEAETSASLAIRRADELVQANVALSAERSAAEAARAEAAAQRDQAEKRAEELQQVSDFQASQLAGVDAEAMGQTIRRMVLERARAAGERAGREQQVLAGEQETLKGLLDGADFTGLALGVLNEEVFERALQELGAFDNQPLVQAQLFEAVAMTQHRLGLSNQALQPQTQAVDLSRRELGDSDRRTLISITNLGAIFHSLGNYREAERLLREVLETRRGTLGADHEDTLRSSSGLSVLLMHEGRYDEAEPLLRETLKSQQDSLGDDHEDTLRSLSNLGTLLTFKGKPAEAEPLFRAALEGQRRLLEDTDTQVLTSLNNLGLTLYQQDKLAEAEEIWREVLAIFRRSKGHEHPNTLSMVSNLSTLLSAQGRLEEAEVLQRQVLEIYNRTRGADHPSTLTSLGNLGNVLLSRNKKDEAETMFREALQGRLRVLGPEHPDTLLALQNLGGALYSNGKLEEAERILREALEGRIRVLGADHPDNLATLRNLGSVLYRLGKLDEAEQVLSRALKGCLQQHGADHPKTVGLKKDLAELRATRMADADNEGEDR
jgi:non-specific serine/threonine protein kinase/serine/threonine-protein kinase